MVFKSYYVLSLLVIILCCTSISRAQPGLLAGYNRSTCDINIQGRATVPRGVSGLHLGAFYRTQGTHVAVQPTLVYSQKGVSDSVLTNTRLHKYKYGYTRLNYLELTVPVLFRFRIPKEDFVIDLGAGPHVARLTRARSFGTEYIAGGKLIEEYAIGNSSWDDFNKWDAGVSFYAGITYLHFAIGLNYDMGVTDISPQRNQELKNRSLSVSLMVIF